MTVALKIGDRTFSGSDVISQLQQYGLLPSLVKELVLESALDAWSRESPEEWTSEQEAQVIQQVKTQQALQAMAPQKGPQPPGAGEAMEKMAIKRAKLDKFKESRWGNKVENYFLQRKVRLDRVIYSLLRLKDAAIAQELYFRLESGESAFTDLATKYSQGPEANTGGLIGPADLGGCHPRLGEMMRVSKPDQLWPPTRIEDWWVVVRLEKFMPAQLDEPMRRRLLEEMFLAWLQEESQKFEVVPEGSPPKATAPVTQVAAAQAVTAQAKADSAEARAAAQPPGDSPTGASPWDAPSGNPSPQLTP